jgi:hypothetical protein
VTVKQEKDGGVLNSGRRQVHLTALPAPRAFVAAVRDYLAELPVGFLSLALGALDRRAPLPARDSARSWHEPLLRCDSPLL